MGHVILIFGTLIALNFGIGHEVSDQLYQDKESQGVVEVQEVASIDTSITPTTDQARTITN